MLKLKRLKITKYRNVKPGTELHFRDSLNVLLGRNGTGKTTLLNLVVQLLSWDFSRMKEEAVDLEYELHKSNRRVVVSVRSGLIQKLPKQLSDVGWFAEDVAALDRVPAGPPKALESEEQHAREEAYRSKFLGLMPSASHYSLLLDVVAFEDDLKKGTLRLQGAMLTLEDGRTLKDGKGGVVDRRSMPYELLDRWTLSSVINGLIYLLNNSVYDYSRPPLLDWVDWLIFWYGKSLVRFDESLGYLDYVAREVSFVAQKNVEDIYKIESTGDAPVGIMQCLRDQFDQNSDMINFKLESGEEGAGFLDRFVKLLDGRSANIQFQRISRDLRPDERTTYGNIRFDLVRRDSSLVNHTLLSYGQKRLLAFCYYLAANPDFVVADELVNGMHHEWIDACLEDLGDRQAFLTSQNPLLLDYLVFESVDEMQDSFVLCRTELHDNQEQWVWENMTDADAEGLFKAYQVAIQHVSELLRTRGLW